jgi:hypothetical protein
LLCTLPMLTERPSQVIEDSTATERSRAQNMTVGCVTFTFDVIPLPSDTPASFFEGLNDYKHGRTVDMETAMSQLPPDRGISI